MLTSYATQEPEKPAAGGFITGVDDVVQPYALPRNLHEIIEHAATSHTALGELKKANASLKADEDEDGESMDADEPVAAAAFRDIKMEVLEDSEDDDGMMEDVPVAPRLNGAPKTMQELAEEAARRDGLKHASADTEEELPIEAAALPAEEKPATASAIGRNTRSGGISTAGSPTAGTFTPRARAKAKAGAKGSGSAAGGRSTPRQTRKRTRTESDVEGEGEGTPAKRRARAPAPAVTPSTRVLRTRKPKDATKVQEEEEMEEAYRQAVAE